MVPTEVEWLYIIIGVHSHAFPEGEENIEHAILQGTHGLLFMSGDKGRLHHVWDVGACGGSFMAWSHWWTDLFHPYIFSGWIETDKIGIVK